jgi:hypothetical protein
MMKNLNPAAKWCLLGYWHDFQSVLRKILWCWNVNSQQIAKPPQRKAGMLISSPRAGFTD